MQLLCEHAQDEQNRSGAKQNLHVTVERRFTQIVNWLVQREITLGPAKQQNTSINKVS